MGGNDRGGETEEAIGELDDAPVEHGESWRGRVA